MCVLLSFLRVRQVCLRDCSVTGPRATVSSVPAAMLQCATGQETLMRFPRAPCCQ